MPYLARLGETPGKPLESEVSSPPAKEKPWVQQQYPCRWPPTPRDPRILAPAYILPKGRHVR